jgi:ribonuclease BN (tRNA processing enzyme)
MKLKVLGCYGGNIPGHGMTSLLINDTLALDAGWVSEALSLKEQEKVKDILISHSHLDHTCSLPFLIDNNFSAPGFSLKIYAIAEVVASMRAHLFNNHTWPDFTSLPNDLTPVLKLIEIAPEHPFTINGLTIRAVKVSHIVPTAGYIVEDKTTAIAFSSDTGPTNRFWEVVNGIKNLKAVITETSFPNELQDLADVSGHLTPATLDVELNKIKKDVPIYLYGGKPKHLKTIKRQLRALKRRKLQMLVQGRTYKF